MEDVVDAETTLVAMVIEFLPGAAMRFAPPADRLSRRLAAGLESGWLKWSYRPISNE